MTDKKEKSTIKIVKPSYQPSKSELESDLRIDATFDQAVEALTKSVNVKYVEKP